MAKKKTGAKKVARKTMTTKATAPKPPMKPKPAANLLEKPKSPAEPKPTESKAASPVAPPKPKATPPKADPAAKEKAEQKSSRGSWPGKEKGYPDPHHVWREYPTATKRIFVMKKETWDIYKERKLVREL